MTAAKVGADRGAAWPRLVGLLSGVIAICASAFWMLDSALAAIGAPPTARTIGVWAGVNIAVWTYLALAHGDNR